MKKTVLLLTSVVSAFLLMSACSKSASQPASSVPGKTPVAVSTPVSSELAINIKDSSFVPNTATLKAGGTVTWTNSDGTKHQLISKDLFDSKGLESDDAFSFTFPRPGTYDYSCSIHPTMMGKIVVIE